METDLLFKDGRDFLYKNIRSMASLFVSFVAISFYYGLLCVNDKEIDKFLMVLSFSPFQMINDTWILSLFTLIPLSQDRVEVLQV